MRVMLDANVLLDCLVLEASGLPRPGKAASDQRAVAQIYSLRTD